MSSYLKAFSTQAEYETYMAGSPLLPNVSLIGDGEGEVAYNPYVAPPLTVGMICYYDGSKLKFCSKNDWNNSLGTAIGVVVVPSTHTPDGTARVISLKAMRYDKPDTGGDRQDMVWGGFNYDAGLTKYTKVPTWNNTIGGTTGRNNNGYLPGDNTGGGYFTGATCACDSITKYSTTSTSSMIPSTYLENGERNTALDVTITGGNAMADFNGKLNTSMIIENATAQTDWKTASAITNSWGKGYYPAACCCWRYSTPGTSQGDWYLPGCGELAYIVPRRVLIEESISLVNGVDLSPFTFCCSSEAYSQTFMYVSAVNGGVFQTNKDNKISVRGFLSVMPNGEIK